MVTKIPEQLLENHDMRYIMIKRKDKRPFEFYWHLDTIEDVIDEYERRKEQKSNTPIPTRVTNYAADDPVFASHLKKGGNYGIKCGYGGLAVLDSDNEETLEKLGVFKKLPETFTVLTGGGGYHRYFYVPDFDRKIILSDENGGHLGEIQWKGAQVVGPGSIHPNGNEYKIINDTEIAKITKEELMDAIKNCKITEPRKPRKQSTTTPQAKDKQQKKAKNNKNYDKHAFGIKIEDIAMPLDAKPRTGANGPELVGTHPIEGSESGGKRNFHINTEKNTWYCWHHNSGGGPLEWIAVKEGIISCDQAGEGCLKDKRKFKKVLEAVEKMGYDTGRNEPTTNQPHVPLAPPTYSNLKKTIIEKLPTNINFDGETKIIVLKAKPRTGKTHATVQMLKNAGEGNYITHNHAIINHAITIFKEIGGTGAVWMEGKYQDGMCREPNKIKNCSKCKRKPLPDNEKGDNIGYMELLGKAQTLLYKHKILTKSEVPYELCPYYTTKLAAKDAKYVFTVVHNIEQVFNDKPRKLTILDEDTTVSHFYTKPIELTSITRTRGETSVINNIEKIMDDINNAIENNKKGLVDYAKKLKEMSDIINESEGFNIIDTEEKLTNAITDWKPRSRYLRDSMDQSNQDDDTATFEDCVRTMGNLYRPAVITSMAGRAGKRTIFMLGDARTPTEYMDWMKKVPEGGKIVIIGNTIAENFAANAEKVYKIPCDVLEIEGFKYADDFIIITLEHDKMVQAIKEVRGKINATEWHPAMVLTGSKANQSWAIEQIGWGTMRSTKEREIEQKRNFRSGAINVFYQNSVMSRGIDIDDYNLLFAFNTDFAEPFWSVADQSMADAIMIDETTNSVLRISPTERRAGGAKVIVMDKDDRWKVPCIPMRNTLEVPDDIDGKTVARALIKAGVPGRVKMEMNALIATETGREIGGVVEKFKDIISNPGKVLTRDEIDAAAALIWKILKENRKCTTRELKAKSGLEQAIFDEATHYLLYSNKVKVKTVRHQAQWCLSSN